MTSQPTVHPKLSVDVSRDEAAMIVEGLRMLLNCRRYSFKDAQDDVRQIYSPLFAAVERWEGLLKEAAALSQAE